jgi:hypothetical protein
MHQMIIRLTNQDNRFENDCENEYLSERIRIATTNARLSKRASPNAKSSLRSEKRSQSRLTELVTLTTASLVSDITGLLVVMAITSYKHTTSHGTVTY